MNKKANLNKLNSLLGQGENIIQYLTKNHMEDTSVEDEMISYDLRAGEDIRRYEQNPELENRVVEKIKSYIKETGYDAASIVECGSGEGLNLTGIISDKECKYSWARGVDISWSRSFVAQRYSRGKIPENIDADFIVGDFFQLPFKDNSIDIVYTMQGIYGMGGREKTLLTELYRITKGYLILIEPSYELGGDNAKKRMERLGYVKGLPATADEMGLNVVKYELFGEDINPLNPAAVLMIKKMAKTAVQDPLCCPITRTDIELIGNAYYSKDAMLSYPVLNGIACLTKENAVVASKMNEIYIDRIEEYEK